MSGAGKSSIEELHVLYEFANPMVSLTKAADPPKAECEVDRPFYNPQGATQEGAEVAGGAQREHLPQTKLLSTADAKRQWLLPAAHRQTGRNRTTHWLFMA